MSSATYKLMATANDHFKSQYPKYMRWALIASFVLTILFFLFSPKVEITPYRIYNEEIELTDIQEEQIELPDIPKEAPKPVRQVEAVPDDEAVDDEEIADTLMDADEMLDFGDLYDDGGGDGFEVSQEKPKLSRFVSPDYPEMARASQLEGTVVVKVQVGPDGSVMQAVVIQGVHPLLDKSAVDAARRCKFIPGKQRGIPVKAWMAIPFAFRLHS